MSKEKNEKPDLREVIAKAYLDLTSKTKRPEAYKALAETGAMHALGIRMFKDQINDLETVYDGEELGKRMAKMYMEMKQPILYAIYGKDVEPEKGVYEGNKFLEEFKKEYKR